MFSYLIYVFYLSAITIVNSIESNKRYGDEDPYYYDYHEYELETYITDLEEINQQGYKIANTDKVDLKVYYEALCMGCRTFHTYVLDVVYKIIGSYIDLKTYPYGNARKGTDENGKTEIICQHGPEECYGNKLHACAIDILKNVSRSEFYNSCVMKGLWGGHGSTDMDATNCGQWLGIDSKPIIECAKTQRGDDLLEYYGRETDKLTNKKYVPWILLNGELFNMEDDLMMKICEALTHPPPQCEPQTR